jgi:hypothetical protein
VNTEPHYKDGGEPHYKRVARLGLSWCRANITKYAERDKGTDIQDLIKVVDYALMELESYAVMSDAMIQKLNAVRGRMNELVASHTIKQVDLSDGSDAVARGYVDQDTEWRKGNNLHFAKQERTR